MDRPNLADWCGGVYLFEEKLKSKLVLTLEITEVPVVKLEPCQNLELLAV